MDTESDEEVVTLRMTSEQKEALEKMALGGNQSVETLVSEVLKIYLENNTKRPVRSSVKIFLTRKKLQHLASQVHDQRRYHRGGGRAVLSVP